MIVTIILLTLSGGIVGYMLDYINGIRSSHGSAHAASEKVAVESAVEYNTKK